PALRQRFLDVEHERFRFSKAGRLDDDDFRRNFFNDLVDCGFEFAAQRTPNAAAAELGDAHVLALDYFRVDGDLTEFVHHDGDLRGIYRQDMSEQCRLPAAKRTGD